MMGGGRESDDVVDQVMLRVPSPTATHVRVMLLPTVVDVLVGCVLKSGVVAVRMQKRMKYM